MYRNYFLKLKVKQKTTQLNCHQFHYKKYIEIFIKTKFSAIENGHPPAETNFSNIF